MRSVIILVILMAMLGLAVPILTRLQSRLLEVDAEAGPKAVGTAALGRPAARPGPRADAKPADTVTVQSTVTVYRWRDRNGTLHIESSPPPQGVTVEVLNLTRTKQVQAASVGPTATSSPTSTLIPRAALSSPLSVYSPEGMEQLLKRLDKTIDDMQERKAVMDELARDL